MQHTKWICFLSLMLLICLAIEVPAAAAAPAPEVHSVQWSKPTNKRAGEFVNLSGSSTLEEVIIKVIRPDQTIFHFAIVPVSNGIFTLNFKLPQDAQQGIYKVVAGKEEIIAVEQFVVAASTNNEGTSEPQVPSPQLEGIKLNGRALTPTTTDNIDGVTILGASVPSDLLSKAISQAAESNPDLPTVVFTVTGYSIGKTGWKIELPIDVLVDAASSTPAAVIVVKGADMSYSLPVAHANLLAGLRKFTADTQKGSLVIEIKQIPDHIKKKMIAAAKSSASELLHEGYLFRLYIDGAEQTKDISGAAGVNVSRTLTVNGTIDPSTATAALFDNATDTFHFMPSIFKAVEENTIAHIKTDINGIYVITAKKATFIDLTSHWAKTAIDALAAKGIAMGKSSRAFLPDDQITRAEFTALLVRVLGLNNSSSVSSSTFLDVPGAAWYTASIAIAEKKGLIKGKGSNLFLPDKPITREEAAVLIVRALDLTGLQTTQTDSTVLNSFIDNNNISDWARHALAYATQKNIVKGYSDDRIIPQNFTTRAQAASMIMRMLQHAEWIN